jgi:hypothetical protein
MTEWVTVRSVEMHRPSAHVFALSLVITTISPVLASDATSSEATTGKNIFSTPQQDAQVPSFSAARGGPGAKVRQMLLGNTRDDIPDFRQVMQLPSLSMQQRKSLREQMKGNKQQVSTIVTRLRAMKERRDTAGGAVTAETRTEFESLRTQLQEIRKRNWEETKHVLSDAQLHDLQAMRKGELQPSTFHAANDEAMMGQ